MLSPEKVKLAGQQSGCVQVKPTRPVSSIFDDVKSGLLNLPRSLPPKYFYDEYGAQLFERICDTEEYYPTRTENTLLHACAGEIIEISSPAHIIELGAGSSRKTRRLFDACEKKQHVCSYSSFDVCEPILIQSAVELENEYPWLTTRPLLGDYNAGLGNLPIDNETNLFVFLGSTIGNFSNDEMFSFINDLGKTMNSGDYFLLGADRVKDTAVLNAAYNDAQGITAKFNLNLLNVLNRETGSNFELSNFEHRAEFNTAANQVEMYLDVLGSQLVEFKKMDLATQFNEGEYILTEISRKFEKNEIEDVLRQSGFDIAEHFEADDEWFSLILARAA